MSDISSKENIDKILEEIDEVLLPLCIAYAQDSTKEHPMNKPIIDKLGSVLHDAILSTVQMFNEQYIEPIIRIKEGNNEST